MITGITTTFNSSNTIRNTLESLDAVCSEIILVDSGSSDSTLEIAGEFDVTIIHQPYLGNGLQNNFAVSFASNSWILLLDSDEYLDQTAIDAILSHQHYLSSNKTGYTIERKNFLSKRFISGCGWSPDPQLRLYHKDFFKFKDDIAHSKVVALTKNNTVLPLDGHIIHLSFKNYHHLFKKANEFSTRGAIILIQKDIKIYTLSAFTHMLAAFIKSYFFKRGYKFGMDGFTISLSQAVYTYLKYAKARERKIDSSSGLFGD